MITQDLAIPFSLTLTTITATVVLGGVGLGYGLFGWIRKRSWRTLVRGAGFVLLPVGLLLAGIMGKFYDGVNALLAWAEQTTRTIPMTIGLGVAGVGFALYAVGSFMPPVLGEEAKARRAAIAEKKAQAQGAPALPTQGAAAPTGFGAAKSATPAPQGGYTPAAPSAAASVGNEDEIDAILRKHGIN